MATITLGGIVTLSGTPSFSAAGKFVDDYEIESPDYQIRLIPSAGVDGNAIKRFGFRSRSITIQATYISSTYNGVISTAVADFAALSNVSFTSTIAGVSFPFCILGRSRIGKVFGVGEKFFSRVNFSIIQTSLE